ncbi:unnamed protein product, partial [Ectocarpus sp. 13 AM-2016]
MKIPTSMTRRSQPRTDQLCGSILPPKIRRGFGHFLPSRKSGLSQQNQSRHIPIYSLMASHCSSCVRVQTVAPLGRRRKASIDDMSRMRSCGRPLESCRSSKGRCRYFWATTRRNP